MNTNIKKILEYNNFKNSITNEEIEIINNKLLNIFEIQKEYINQFKKFFEKGIKNKEQLDCLLNSINIHILDYRINERDFIKDNFYYKIIFYNKQILIYIDKNILSQKFNIIPNIEQNEFSYNKTDWFNIYKLFDFDNNISYDLIINYDKLFFIIYELLNTLLINKI